MLKDTIKTRICNMLTRCSGTAKDCLFPPTILYNEGWMLRLVLDWFASQGDAMSGHPLCIPSGCRWYSEALLPSRFKPRMRGDSLAESYTHADGVIGHFDIGGSGRGDLRFNPNGKRLVIIEAKMFSPLSAGTKNAPQYNQAARNVACMANILSLQPGHKPAEMSFLGFYVLAPESQIKDGVFAEALTVESLRGAVMQRIAQYKDQKESEELTAWFHQWYEPFLAKLVDSICPLSWESILKFIKDKDPETGSVLFDFYESCKEYNPKPKRKDTR